MTPITASNARQSALEARRDELLTVSEYAQLLRVCDKTVYRRIWNQRQPGAVRLGGQWRIDLTQAMQAPVSKFVP